MVDPNLYDESCFVLLDSSSTEQFFTPDELKQYLKARLQDYPEATPSEVESLGSPDEQAAYLVKNYCELSLSGDRTLQWYAVRLEK
ncbi:MAG: chlororespiratory reduction protein 7 [Elainellaceae cyanobacterium]